MSTILTKFPTKVMILKNGEIKFWSKLKTSKVGSVKFSDFDEKKVLYHSGEIKNR